MVCVDYKHPECDEKKDTTKRDMVVREAKKIISEYQQNGYKSDEDDFSYEEALDFLIKGTGESRYMYELAKHYEKTGREELSHKYLKAAADNGYEPAIVKMDKLR